MKFHMQILELQVMILTDLTEMLMTELVVNHGKKRFFNTRDIETPDPSILDRDDCLSLMRMMEKTK